MEKGKPEGKGRKGGALMDFELNDKFAMPFQNLTGIGADSGSSFDKVNGAGGKAVGGVGKSEGVDGEKKTGGKSSPEDCETCKNRKYKDGSDESDVSFQTATHIDPTAAGARVRVHEQEHVTNAYSKAAEAGGKVISVGVALHTAVCPECGRTYVSGGVTHSVIAYPGENGTSKIKSSNGDPEDAPAEGTSEGSVSATGAGSRGGRENFSVADFGGSKPRESAAVRVGTVTAKPAADPDPAAGSRPANGRAVTGAFRAAARGHMPQVNPYAAAQKASENRRASGAIFRARV